MITFKIVRARYRGRCTRTGDYYKTALIEADTLAEQERAKNLGYFFPHASEINEIRVIGEIQVEGDVHQLGDTYMED
jgi:hypothetical protein